MRQHLLTLATLLCICFVAKNDCEAQSSPYCTATAGTPIGSPKLTPIVLNCNNIPQTTIVSVQAHKILSMNINGIVYDKTYKGVPVTLLPVTIQMPITGTGNPVPVYVGQSATANLPTGSGNYMIIFTATPANGGVAKDIGGIWTSP